MTIPDIQTLGIIGAGQIGSQLARLALGHGYDVVIANSRGPETLFDLVGELGDRAEAASAAGAAAQADLAVVTVPLEAISNLPEAELEGKIVIDTCNYYPDRDGHIAELDEERTTTSELVQQALPQSRVVKGFNHIFAADITTDAEPAGTPDRRALAIAGDDSQAKDVVAAFIDELGYDVVDIGDLAESWRIQRDTPGYTVWLDRDDLITALAAATRPPNPETEPGNR